MTKWKKKRNYKLWLAKNKVKVCVVIFVRLVFFLKLSTFLSVLLFGFSSQYSVFWNSAAISTYIACMQTHCWNMIVLKYEKSLIIFYCYERLLWRTTTICVPERYQRDVAFCTCARVLTIWVYIAFSRT